MVQSRDQFTVFLVWLFAGACFGGAAGLTVDIQQATTSFLMTGLLTGLGLGGVVGALWNLLTARQLLGGRFQSPAVAILAAIGVAVTGLSWAGGLLSMRMGAVAPGILSGVLCLALLVWGRTIYGNYVLWLGIQAYNDGDRPRAVHLLRVCSEATLAVPKPQRNQALYTLGTMHLERGDLRTAESYLRQVPAGGRSGTLAHLGLAVIWGIEGNLTAAERALREVNLTKGGPQARAQLEGIRLLLTLRGEGVSAARELMESRSVDGRSGLLMLGLSAWLEWQEGDVEGARFLLGPQGAQRLRRYGLTPHIPELQELVRQT